MVNAQLSNAGLLKIFEWETGGKAYYDKFLSKPSWPGKDSGITIGGGYDLGYNSATQIRQDWEGKINNNALVLLLQCSGIKGIAAKRLLTTLVRQIVVPYTVAYEVFISKSVPRFYKEALAVFPEMPKLNADTQAMLLSVVFNRGNALVERSRQSILEQNRKEMKLLVDAVAKQDYATIANLIEQMKRLWDGLPDFDGDVETKLTGLVKRREEEAAMVRASVKKVYVGAELLQLTITA